MKPIIIPEAINKYFADNIPIEHTIKSCKDLKKFITYQKVNKEYSVEYNGQLIQRINRYYISTRGYSIFKCKVDQDGQRSKYISLLQDYGVKIVNNMDNISGIPDDIDYRYYISAANKIIKKLETQQLSLF